MKLTWLAGKGEWEVVAVEQGLFFFSYFPPLKPRYVLWSGESYSPKNTVISVSVRIIWWQPPRWSPNLPTWISVGLGHELKLWTLTSGWLRLTFSQVSLSPIFQLESWIHLLNMASESRNSRPFSPPGSKNYCLVLCIIFSPSEYSLEGNSCNRLNLNFSQTLTHQDGHYQKTEKQKYETSVLVRM